MFGKEWFIKHQRKLIWLLNTPIISFWFRRIMKIDYKKRITEILPNSYSWGDKLVYKNRKFYFQRTTDFRTHNKYSKRLYYIFKPLWILFHWWDILIANRFQPNWSLGFDQTFYPDAGTGGSNVVDGRIQYSGAAAGWATVRGDDGTNATATDTDSNERAALIGCAGSSSDFAVIARSIYLFDTSAIDDSATITATTFSLYGTDTITTASWEITLNIYSATPANTNAIVNADYNITNFGSTAFCDSGIAETSWNTSAYNDFDLNSSGLAAISKTGVTKLGILDQTYDRANSAPTWSANVQSAVYANYADYEGTTEDPKLVVTYTITISPPAGTIALSGQVPTVTTTITISVPAGTITITANIPTVDVSGGYDFNTKNTASWTYQSKS